MAPTPEEVQVACKALRSDATKWTTASDEMAAGGGSAQSLVLGRAEFGYAAENHGLVTSYTTIQERIATLLTGADAEFDKMAAALRLAADTYEREDAEGAHKFDQMGN
ncbi:MAG: hypothetical protein ABW215_05990 [Kibdelosporangium sp.]